MNCRVSLQVRSVMTFFSLLSIEYICTLYTNQAKPGLISLECNLSMDIVISLNDIKSISFLSVRTDSNE